MVARVSKDTGDEYVTYFTEDERYTIGDAMSAYLAAGTTIEILAYYPWMRDDMARRVDNKIAICKGIDNAEQLTKEE